MVIKRLKNKCKVWENKDGKDALGLSWDRGKYKFQRGEKGYPFGSSLISLFPSPFLALFEVIVLELEQSTEFCLGMCSEPTGTE